MAEGIFQHLVHESNLSEHFIIDSAGMSSHHEGENYHPQTLRVIKENGIRLTGTSRPVVFSDFTDFDYIAAMDESNYRALLERAPERIASQIFLVRDFDSEAAQKPSSVPDPYFGGPDGFERVFNLLYRSCEAFLKKLIKDHGLH